LSGEIPASLFTANWSKLTDLNLSDNYFTGAFPSSIGNCTSLLTFRVMNNRFTSIPQALLTSTKLSAINLSNNALTSIPNFVDYANNSKLSMVVSLNYLGYNMLEPLVNSTTGAVITKSLTYRPQKIFDQVRRVDVPLGNTLELPATTKGTYGSIVWEKKNTNGTWTNINSTNADNSQQTYRLLNVTAAAAGIYRWTATNTKLTSATLQSIEMDVRVVEAVKQTGDHGIALYNGLISAARWRTTKARGATGDDLKGMYVYQYDDKYQIKDASWADANNTLNTYSWGGNRFRLTGMEYDANGNIRKLNRYNDQSQQQHTFQYHYKDNTNRLTSIDGYAQAYDYDEIGRTTKVDKAEGDDQYIDYDVTGKVIAVYSTVEKRPQDKQVEYLYDDRGFRMAKINYKLNRTTWYIRDAVGSILNVYDQEGTQESVNNNPATKTEMPVYAGSKIGTYYPAQDGSLEYELTDHLGNVRALVREDVKTYTATMEDNGQESISNPRIEEGQYFQNIAETEQVDVHMNHTDATGNVLVPSRSSYLYWNDTPGTLVSQKSTGPAIALEVQPGDTVRAEAYVRFEEKVSYSHTGITLSLLSTMLGNTFAFAGGVDGATPIRVSEWFNGALSAPGFLNYTNENERPNAFLSYIIFDADMVRIGGYRQPIPVEAGFVAGEEVLDNAHERVSLPQPVIVPAGGKYIYVWVSNESPETRVWFDDVSVTHTTSYVSQATDYGAWGDVLRTVSTEPAPAALLRKNLKGQYAFSGNAQDQSGNGLNGTVSGAVLTTGVDGEANKAYSFNGVNSYVKLEGSAEKLSFVQNTGVFTIAAYIKLNDLNARSAIVSSITSTSQKGFAFVFDTFGGDYGTHALRFSSTRGDGSSLNLGTGTNYAINDTEWHHVAVVGDGSTFRFYIDGQPDGYATAFNSFSSGTSVGDVLIGASRTTATNIQLPMNGSIDEVHIFDKALSGSEIRLLAEGASPEQIDQVLQPVNRGYRYQYQGQYAEKDDETGWSHFELREYDPIIGRWLVPDPMGQHWSPYMAMGNTPVSNIDPDGGRDSGPGDECPECAGMGVMLDGYVVESKFEGRRDGSLAGLSFGDFGNDNSFYQYDQAGSIYQTFNLIEGHVTYKYSDGNWSLYRDEKHLANAYTANMVNAADAIELFYATTIGISMAGFGPALQNTSLSAGRVTYTFKDIQTMSGAYAAEMRAFFSSGGRLVPTKDALIAYRELAHRILTQTGGAPATKLSETALKVQAERLDLVTKILNALK
ncbi:LamG-like jellyroll fold domain-containing protein, partial [Parachryseolinea silvisoli]|uniref:LamG-like jellyroll fold domain-containing protein n=1 Tax=Parachryseolinea silvisoli TaxID=2873601 RepID=UPI0022658640